MNTSDASSSDAVFSSSPSSLLLGAVHAHVRSAMSAFERDVPPDEFRRRMLAFWTGLARLLQRAHAGAEA